MGVLLLVWLDPSLSLSLDDETARVLAHTLTTPYEASHTLSPRPPLL